MRRRRARGRRRARQGVGARERRPATSADDLAAGARVGEPARLGTASSDGLLTCAVPALDEDQDAPGQMTFASSRSRRTSSGTAAAPSPTMRPAGAPAAARATAPRAARRRRVGGLLLDRLLLRRHDALEDGVARLVEPLLRRDHGRQRQLDDLDAALDLARRRGLPPSASSSFTTTVAHGRSSSSASIGPTWAASSSTACLPHRTRSKPLPRSSRRQQRGRRAERSPDRLSVLSSTARVGAHGERVAQRRHVPDPPTENTTTSPAAGPP